MSDTSSGYWYPSAGAALRRYYYLHLDLQCAGSMPMNPDDLISSNHVSGDTPSMTEWIDLGRVVSKLNHEEQVCLYFEFTEPAMTVVKEDHSDNVMQFAHHRRDKLQEIQRLCGIKLNARSYDVIVRKALKKVRLMMEEREWIPYRKRDATTSNPQRH